MSRAAKEATFVIRRGGSQTSRWGSFRWGRSRDHSIARRPASVILTLEMKALGHVLSQSEFPRSRTSADKADRQLDTQSVDRYQRFGIAMRLSAYRVCGAGLCLSAVETQIIGRDGHHFIRATTCSIIFIACDTLDCVPARFKEFSWFA
jgi:hypothetical protein